MKYNQFEQSKENSYFGNILRDHCEKLGNQLHIGFLILVTLFITSCQSANPEETAIISAQTCLDRLTKDKASEAMSCISSLDSISTPQASMMKCSAVFIKQGFSDPDKLTQIAEQMKNSGSNSSSSTFVVIGLLSFTGTSRSDEAAYALDHCSKSGSKGMTLLASLTNIATSAGEFVDVVNACSGSDTSACADTVRDGVCSSSNSSLGQMAITTYQTSCGGVDLANPMCLVYKEATLNGTDNDPESVGNRLKSHLNENNACT